MNTVLSVIIPAFNEQEMIHKTAQTISTLLESHSIPYELIFVDDGSKDQTWFQIVEATKAYDHINGIRFSRNFGKESAIFAGLSTAYQSRGPEEKGCCVVIDCDLQHPPEKIIDMYRLWQQGFQVVEGIKLDRGKENVLHTLAAKCFYCMISKATNIDMSHASDFKLLDDKAVQALLSMPERNAFFRALSSWIGFQTAQVEFEVQDRTVGKSKWSTLSLIKYAIRNITSFSTFPMQIVSVLGVLMLLASVVLGGIALIQKCLGVALEGFTTVIIIQLFTGSIVMISLGIIGYYLAKMYEELQRRPRYLISESCGGLKDDTKTIG